MSGKSIPGIPDFSTPAGLGPRPVFPPPGSGPPPVDQAAVTDAKREIHGLVREIADLVRADIEPQRFYAELTTRIVAALAASGGAVWVPQDDGRLRLAYELNVPAAVRIPAGGVAEHELLLLEIFERGEDALVPPRSASRAASTGHETSAGNPTDCVLILGFLRSDTGPEALVEIFQRSDTRTTSQRGFQKFVRQMCDLGGDYLKSRRLRHLVDRQSSWEQLESFTRLVHVELDVRRTAYTIANEGRRLAGCDRVSVALQRGGRMRIEAISGQESFDPRASQVVRLAELADAATATGEPLWYQGESSDFAPQIESALTSYLDLAHARLVAVLPLVAKTDAATPGHAPEPLGALIVEQLDSSRALDHVRERVDVIQAHAAVALANALEHESVFLLPLWRRLGKVRAIARLRNLPKTAAALLAAGLVVAVLALVPADFTLEAKGTLEPARRRDLFAGLHGVVVDVAARHGELVKQGQVLVRLRNTELDIQIADLVGRRDATAKQIQSLGRSMLGDKRPTAEEQNRLGGQVLQLKKTLESLDRQLALCQKKRDLLGVASPIDGQVITWQVEERLNRRPVREGQVLLSVADPAGPWELWIDMPEDRMGHVSQAAAASREPLPVSYILATQPGETHEGQVAEIHTAAEVRENGENSVRLRVEIDKTVLSDLRPGATVTAKVNCGHRALGYVWLHDLVRFVQAKVLFRL